MSGRAPTLTALDGRARRYCLLCALAAGAVVVGALGLRPRSVWPPLFLAWVFWLGVSLGCAGIALLHRLTGGRWGLSIERDLVAATWALPAMALVGVLMLAGHPVITGFESPESAPETAALHGATHGPGVAALNAQQQRYFRPVWVLVRGVAYFAGWIGCAWLAFHRHRELAGTAVRRLSPRLSAIGLIVFWGAGSFATFDWLMSLDPDWYSTVYGALHLMGFVVSGMAFVILMRALGGLPAAAEESRQRTHDLGNLLLAFNLLWVYLAFCQWLIVWSADLPFESAWYLRRLHGFWSATALLLVCFHFVVPFALLLSRDLKRDAQRLGIVAGLLLLARVMDLAWNILPAVEGVTAATGVLLPVALAGVGGLWGFSYLSALRILPELPLAAEEGIGPQSAHSEAIP